MVMSGQLALSKNGLDRSPFQDGLELFLGDGVFIFQIASSFSFAGWIPSSQNVCREIWLVSV